MGHLKQFFRSKALSTGEAKDDHRIQYPVKSSLSRAGGHHEDMAPSGLALCDNCSRAFARENRMKQLPWRSKREK